MNLKFTDKTSEISFTNALKESKVVQNWLINKLSDYQKVSVQVTLEIQIDPWTKTEKPSYNWSIYSQKIDDYGLPINKDEFKGILNGGLIHRGDNNYSSHT